MSITCKFCPKMNCFCIYDISRGTQTSLNTRKHKVTDKLKFDTYSQINRMTRSFIFRSIPLIYLIYIKNIYNVSLIIQSALSSKNNKCLNKLKVINNISLKFEISDVLPHKLKVSYKGVSESVVLLH